MGPECVSREWATRVSEQICAGLQGGRQTDEGGADFAVWRVEAWTNGRELVAVDGDDMVVRTIKVGTLDWHEAG